LQRPSIFHIISKQGNTIVHQL